MFKKNIFVFFILILILIKNSYADDIPIIVISAGKSAQSKSIVGSDVSLITNESINNSNEFFVGDLLSENLIGMSYFQTGGYGTTSGIQLRGQPKRYSTVYINGVKLSDPSTPSNDYYFGNLLNNSFERIEVLKGSQSTLYGSGAIAGTLNLFTKKGTEGHHQNIDVSAGSFGTKTGNFSLNGKENNFDYFIGYTNFSTDGISARIDDDENDRYRNDNFEGNFGYQINNILRIENYFNYSDLFLEYDSVNPSNSDNNSTDDTQGIYSGKFIIDNGNLKNTFSFNKTYFLRNVMDYNKSPVQENYESTRESINLLGQYNFNLDTRIIYGLENEFDKAEIPSNYPTGSTYQSAVYIQREENINSQYIDLQFKPWRQINSTLGFRRDDHSLAGDYNTGRFTLAYNLDNYSKVRSSFGTGLRFPSLNEYYFGSSVKDSSSLKPEKSRSFDFGIDVYDPIKKINLSATIYRINYENYIGSWAKNTDNGNTWVQKNTNAINRSSGIEILSSWEMQKDLNIDLGYTYSSSHDGSTCSNPDDTCNASQNVRIPRHSIMSSISKKFSNNFISTIKVKYVGDRRDYGGSDNGFQQVFLNEYLVTNLYTDYKFYNYNMNFAIKNLFDEDYNEALNYSTPGRSFNYKLRREF